MNKELGWIIFYVIIVGLSIFITYKRFLILSEAQGDTPMNYAMFIVFIVFTFINLRLLIKRINEYRK